MACSAYPKYFEDVHVLDVISGLSHACDVLFREQHEVDNYYIEAVLISVIFLRPNKLMLRS